MLVAHASRRKQKSYRLNQPSGGSRGLVNGWVHSERVHLWNRKNAYFLVSKNVSPALKDLIQNFYTQLKRLQRHIQLVKTAFIS